MNVFIIGATGYIGTAVDGALRARGHRVVGAARSDLARHKLALRGTHAVNADAAKPETLIPALRAADAVVYTVQSSDADPFAVDSGVLRIVRRNLAGTEKTFVFVSRAWVYGATGTLEANEDARLSPPPHVARRIELERATLAMTKVGVRALIIRPGIAYGKGGGLPAMFSQSARERGAATIVGDGHNRWATIDVGDLGMLIALALERGRPGRTYNAVNDDRFAQGTIAAAASRGAGAGGATTSISAELLGQFGECLALDQALSGARAQRDLDWRPMAPSILADLEHGSYKLTARAR